MVKPPCLLFVLALSPAMTPQCSGKSPTTPPSETPPAQSAPTQVTVANVNERTVGSIRMYSSTQLTVTWTAPSGSVDHYELAAIDGATGGTLRGTTTATTATLTSLKAATSYSVTVTACGDASCSKAGSATAVTGTTSPEYWQLMGSGNTVNGLTKIVSDGNARISATRFGPEAGTNADRLQLYYGPAATNPQALATAFTSQRTDATVPASYVSFVSMSGTTGLISPTTASTLVRQLATGQGVPLSAAMGGKVRRWNGEAGTFMVFTTEAISACTTFGPNHGYAVWTGTTWSVQYATDGCPKLFKGIQAGFPMHIGGVRYKMYYGNPSNRTGVITGSPLPFLGPKTLIYADGANTASSTDVDFEDWEPMTAARNVIFLWPNGEQLNDTAEGYIDDYHFMAPTGSLSLQVMYMAITNGTLVPIGAGAVLLNP